MKKKLNHAAITPIVFTFLLGSLQAQELAPDDPSIAGNLRAWFRDATTTYDSETGIWADSSGNGNNAEPVGVVGGTITYLAPTLGAITGGGLTDGEELAAVRFASDVDDLLVVSDLNANAGLANLTIFVVCNVSLNGTNASATRVAGFGSIAGTQVNSGDNFNLASDPSIRRDNGQVGAGTYSQPFPDGTTFIRTALMDQLTVAEWFNTDGDLDMVQNVNGSSFTTSSDDFYLGDVRAGNTTVSGSTARSDIDVVQAIVYDRALSDAEVAGVNEWLVNNLVSALPEVAALEITGIELNATADAATVTWTSRPGVTYALDFSEDLVSWEEVEGDIASGGAVTTFTETGLEPGRRRFYQVRELEQ